MLTLAMCTNQVKKYDMPTMASWWTTKMPNKRNPQRARHNKGTKQLGQQKDYIPLVRTTFLATSFKRISPLPLAPLDMNEEDSKVGKDIPYKTCCYYSISILKWFNNKWVHLVNINWINTWGRFLDMDHMTWETNRQKLVTIGMAPIVWPAPASLPPIIGDQTMWTIPITNRGIPAHHRRPSFRTPAHFVQRAIPLGLIAETGRLTAGK